MAITDLEWRVEAIISATKKSSPGRSGRWRSGGEIIGRPLWTNRHRVVDNHRAMPSSELRRRLLPPRLTIHQWDVVAGVRCGCGSAGPSLRYASSSSTTQIWYRAPPTLRAATAIGYSPSRVRDVLWCHGLRSRARRRVIGPGDVERGVALYRKLVSLTGWQHRARRDGQLRKTRQQRKRDRRYPGLVDPHRVRARQHRKRKLAEHGGERCMYISIGEERRRERRERSHVIT